MIDFFSLSYLTMSKETESSLDELYNRTPRYWSLELFSLKKMFNKSLSNWDKMFSLAVGVRLRVCHNNQLHTNATSTIHFLLFWGLLQIWKHQAVKTYYTYTSTPLQLPCKQEANKRARVSNEHLSDDTFSYSAKINASLTSLPTVKSIGWIYLQAETQISTFPFLKSIYLWVLGIEHRVSYM